MHNRKKHILNVDGEVTSPPLHDSELISVNTDDSIVSLLFKLDDGSNVYCYLNDTEQFVCNNFRQGNIVLDLTVITGDLLSDELKFKIFPASRVKNEKFDRYIESINNKLQKNELIIIQLNPSYGCEITAICSSISFNSSRKEKGQT